MVGDPQKQINWTKNIFWGLSTPGCLSLSLSLFFFFAVHYKITTVSTGILHRPDGWELLTITRRGLQTFVHWPRPVIIFTHQLSFI